MTRVLNGAYLKFIGHVTIIKLETKSSEYKWPSLLHGFVQLYFTVIWRLSYMVGLDYPFLLLSTFLYGRIHQFISQTKDFQKNVRSIRHCLLNWKNKFSNTIVHIIKYILLLFSNPSGPMKLLNLRWSVLFLCLGGTIFRF